MPACIRWADERHLECTATADRGYNECTATRDAGYAACCTWWPCSWLCSAWVWLSNVVCVAWTWVSNVVCVAWTWVTTAVCVLWDVATTIVGAIITVLESTLGWLLSAVAAAVELVMAIPVIGALIRWIVNIATHVLSIVISIIDAGLGLIGVRPEKKLRVCAVILRDENGTPVASVAVAVSLLQLAANVYKRDANVRILPLQMFKFSTGFSGPETVAASWITTESITSTTTTLDVPCNEGGAGADWGLPGSGFQLKATTNCFLGAWRRVTGYGAPVSCFFIRSIPSPPGSLGCALWITDYATIVGETTLPSLSARVLAHEVGHACNLFHVCVDEDNMNLMATTGACTPSSNTPPDRTNPRMSNLQVIAVRMSKHVTYF